MTSVLPASDSNAHAQAAERQYDRVTNLLHPQSASLLAQAKVFSFIKSFGEGLRQALSVESAVALGDRLNTDIIGACEEVLHFLEHADSEQAGSIVGEALERLVSSATSS